MSTIVKHGFIIRYRLVLHLSHNLFAVVKDKGNWYSSAFLLQCDVFPSETASLIHWGFFCCYCWVSETNMEMLACSELWRNTHLPHHQQHSRRWRLTNPANAGGKNGGNILSQDWSHIYVSLYVQSIREVIGCRGRGLCSSLKVSQITHMWGGSKTWQNNWLLYGVFLVVFLFFVVFLSNPQFRGYLAVVL